MRSLKKPCFLPRKTLAISLALGSQSCLSLLHVARGQSLFRKSRKSLSRNPREQFPGASNWVQGLDLNQRPSGYEPDELPGCSTLQQMGAVNVAGDCGLSMAFSHKVSIPACQGRANAVFSTFSASREAVVSGSLPSTSTVNFDRKAALLADLCVAVSRSKNVS